MISPLDTHETVKHLTAAGFIALTAAVKNAVDIDLANLATKTDIADMRREITDVRREIADANAELVKWVVEPGFAQVATLLVVLKVFPGIHPLRAGA
jgi:hypothetical protein